MTVVGHVFWAKAGEGMLEERFFEVGILERLVDGIVVRRVVALGFCEGGLTEGQVGVEEGRAGWHGGEVLLGEEHFFGTLAKLGRVSAGPVFIEVMIELTDGAGEMRGAQPVLVGVFLHTGP